MVLPEDLRSELLTSYGRGELTSYHRNLLRAVEVWRNREVGAFLWTKVGNKLPYCRYRPSQAARGAADGSQLRQAAGAEQGIRVTIRHRPPHIEQVLPCER